MLVFVCFKSQSRYKPYLLFLVYYPHPTSLKEMLLSLSSKSHALHPARQQHFWGKEIFMSNPNQNLFPPQNYKIQKAQTSNIDGSRSPGFRVSPLRTYQV